MPFDGTTSPHLHRLILIDAVIDVLRDEERWCKGALINRRGQMCLMGAMRRTHGDNELRPAILQAIKEVTEQDFRTIESFNDHRATTHDRLMQVLIRARSNIEFGRAAEKPRMGDGATWRSLWQRLTAAF